MAAQPNPLALRVKSFLQSHSVLGEHLGVAVSGGLDSMCLLQLLLELGYTPAVVHANHQLRGTESEGDEAMVRTFAAQHGLPFFVRRVDVQTHAAGSALSTQMAARQLRYAFFEELTDPSRPDGIRYLLTAHHADDQVETLLLGLLRGREWNILGTIPAERGPYLRPLLTTSRAELEAYQQSRGVPYREDSSNAEDVYLRNQLRHQVIPLLRDINPNLTGHLQEKLALYQEQLDTLKLLMSAQGYPALTLHPDGGISIPVEGPSDAPALRMKLIHHLPAPFQWKYVHVMRLLTLWEAQVGKQLAFPGYTAWRERDHILLKPESSIPQWYLSAVSLGEVYLLPTGRLVTQVFPETPAVWEGECLDYAALQLPLTLRPWQEGDRYQPLGMQGNQNVSDILTDRKVPTHLRRSYWVLEDAEGIVLLQGHRPAERVKRTPQTTRTVCVRWEPAEG